MAGFPSISVAPLLFSLFRLFDYSALIQHSLLQDKVLLCLLCALIWISS